MTYLVSMIQEAIRRIKEGTPTRILTEEFYDATSVFSQYSRSADKTYVEVFKNPTYAEIRSISKDSEVAGVRIGVVPRGEVYVWTGDVLHHVIENKFKLLFVWKLSWDEGDTKLYVSVDQRVSSLRGLRKVVQDTITTRLKRAFPTVTGIYDEQGKKTLLKMSDE